MNKDPDIDYSQYTPPPDHVAEHMALLDAAKQSTAFAKSGRSGTKIEWADHTWNFIAGCSKVSPGCENCYAIDSAAANARRGQAHYVGLTKKLLNGQLAWTGNVVEAPAHFMLKPLKYPAGAVVFVNSMSDFFHEKVTDDVRHRAFDIVRARRDLAFLILSKRPEAMAAFFSRSATAAPDNVWLGVTVESMQHVHRIDILRQLEASVRFMSVEPLIDDVAMNGLDLTGIDWVIAGGESGKRARLMRIEWVRRVRDACAAQGVPFFMKQWGTWRQNPLARDEEGRLRKFREFDALDPHGKGGALLDGRLWREMPRLYAERWAPLYRPKRRLSVLHGGEVS